jgi:tetratricopeptide (TPR) repeat protein
MAEAPNDEEKGGSQAGATPRSDAASRLAARRAAKAAAKAAKRGTGPVVPGNVTKQVQAARSFYDEHGRLLLAGVFAVLLISVLWIVISARMAEGAGQAAAQLHAGVSARNGMVLEEGQDEPEGTLAETFPSTTARAEKARDEFEKTGKQFADSPAATWATLGHANALRDLGKHSEAAKLYERVVADKDAPAFLRARALEGVAFALEADQKFDAALKQYDALAELDKGAHKPLADYHRARMQVALGQKQKAAELLEALIKAERARPASEGKRYETVLSNAETLLTELSVELNAPKLRADLPSAAPAHGSGAGITTDLIEALRKQLGAGEGGAATQQVIDALQQQMNTGEPGSTTVTIPAPKGEGANAEPE